MEVGIVDVDVCVSSHLKEELPLAVDKWFGVLVLQCYLKNSKNTKELNGTKG